MSDLDSDSVIVIEPLDEDNTDLGVLDPYTGVLQRPVKYPCIDLVNTSDEDEIVTVESSKKRVWRETNKHEWLNIYQKYMQQRSNRLPKSLQFRGHLSTDIAVEKNAIGDVETTDNTGETLYLDLAESDHEESDKQKTIFKVKLRNMQYNCLKLLKYSNVCLFEWTEHYISCYICKEWFKDMQSVRNHVKDSHSFIQIKKIIREKNTFHKVDITDLKCKICYDGVDSWSELENHLQRHDITLKPGGSSLIPYKVCDDTVTLICQLCGDLFGTRYRLQSHMYGHTLNNGICEENNELPNTRSHMKNCRSSDKKSSSTLKFVKQRLKLSSHQMALKEQKLKCSYCLKKFKCESNTLRHMFEVHDVRSKLYQCDFCPKIFMTQHWLTKHMICVHQESL